MLSPVPVNLTSLFVFLLVPEIMPWILHKVGKHFPTELVSTILLLRQDLNLLTRLALNLQSPCLNSKVAGIWGLCHQA